MQATLDVARAADVSVSDVNAIGVGIPGHRRPSCWAMFGSRSTSASATTRSTSGSRLTDELGVDGACRERRPCRSSRCRLVPVERTRPCQRPRLPQHRHRHRRRLRRARSVAARQHLGRRRDRPHPDRPATGPLCACGQIGCIEAISSGSAIERMWPTENGCGGRRAASRRVRRRRRMPGGCGPE